MELYWFGQVREAEKPAVLPWDSIPPANITRWPGAPDLHLLKEIAGGYQYAAIDQKSNWLAAHDTAAVPMDVVGYIQFAAARQENINELNQLLKIPVGKQDKVSPASFPFMKEPVAYQRWLAFVQSDWFVNTAVGVLAGWVAQK